MDKAMTAIKIFEMTESGLREVFELETEHIKDKKRQAEALEQLTEMAFQKDSMFLVNETGSFVIRDLKTKTIVFRIVFERGGQY
jgi:hypothetical protein